MSIILECLTRKAKEREKYKRARDQRPAEYPEATSQIRVVLPYDGRDLDDFGIVSMRVSPAFPRLDTRLRIGDDEVCPQRNGPEYIDGRKGHQPEVPATIETWTRGHHLPKLTLAPVERVNACS